jgi:uncharacterized membrane protein
VTETALGVVLTMSAVTYATKAGGFWLLDRIDLPASGRDALDALPGGIVVAFLAVRLSNGGPSEWLAAVAVLAVARRTGSVLAAMIAGVGTLVALRGGLSLPV